MVRWWAPVAACAAVVAMTPGVGRGQDCVGTCYNSASVSITDLIVGVQIALGSFALSVCPTFDANGDQQVTVDELLLAVWNAMVGCGNPRIDANRCALAPRLTSAADGFGRSLSTATATRETADPTLSCGCASSPRTVWAAYTAPADGVLHVRALAAPPGHALAIHGGACAASTELACDDADPALLTAVLPVTAGAPYLLELSGPCDGPGGSARLLADLCGDGATTGDEHCDDGNATAGDGCDAQCRYEGIGGVDRRAGGCGSGGSINLIVGPIGQLFAPTATTLAGVDLLLASQLARSQPVTVRLRRGDLAGPVLAEETIATTIAAGTAWHHVRFAAPVSVTPGETHAIEAVPDGDNVSWVRTSASPLCPLSYPGGGGIAAGSRLRGEDLVFRTYGGAPSQP